MSKTLLAEFAHARNLREAAEAARRRGDKLLDAFTPFPVEDVADMLDGRPSKVRLFMFVGGIVIGACRSPLCTRRGVGRQSLCKNLRPRPKSLASGWNASRWRQRCSARATS